MWNHRHKVRMDIIRDPLTGRLEPATCKLLDVYDYATVKLPGSFNYRAALRIQANRNRERDSQKGERI